MHEMWVLIININKIDKMKDAKQYANEFTQRDKYTTVENFAQAIINDAKQDQLDTLLEILDSFEDQTTSIFLLHEIMKIKLELRINN